jgi:ATPase family AAA domain-containing protein 3A/B
MRRQEETANRIEDMKKRTLDYEAQLRKQTEEAKAIAETKGRIMQERENFDLMMQRAKLEVGFSVLSWLCLSLVLDMYLP